MEQGRWLKTVPSWLWSQVWRWRTCLSCSREQWPLASTTWPSEQSAILHYGTAKPSIGNQVISKIWCVSLWRLHSRDDTPQVVSVSGSQAIIQEARVDPQWYLWTNSGGFDWWKQVLCYLYWSLLSLCVCLFLKHKSEVLKKFQEFEAIVTNESGEKIVKLRTDNGGEYVSTEFQSLKACSMSLL